MRLGLWLLLLRLSAGHPPGHPGSTTGGGVPVSPQTPHWEVFPELSHDGQTLSLDEALQALPPQLQLRIEIAGNKVHIGLHHNRQLLPDFHSISYYLPDGTRVTERGQQPVNCYYHGKPAGGDGPWSSLSLCSGLRGTIVLSAEQRFSIEPVLGDPSFMHIVRPIKKKQNATCGTPDEDLSVGEWMGRSLLSLSEEASHPETPSQQETRDVEGEVKYVELVMVADNNEFTMLHKDLRGLHVRLVEIANRMDAFYRVLNVRVALVMVEVWSQKDLISVSEDPAETLNRFLYWREKDLIRRVHHDNAQLLTGVTFKGSSVGMATMNSICTVDRSGGVTSDHSISVLAVASTMAHGLGHNLGFNHDVADGTCGQPRMGKQWIMTKSTGFMPGLEFSNCSVRDLSTSLRQGGGMCLFNVPSPSTLYGKPVCGNLLVEDGEQCDCGLLQDCSDPCCNASSCRLMPGAECSSDGLCCEKCKVKVPGTVCRSPLGECDLPEYCDGVSPQCPANVYLQDGEPCGHGQAHCHQGECRTLQKQCQDLWGPGSSPAPDSCFLKVNARGDKYGNCGRAPNGSYLPCTLRSFRCGSVQCLGGRDRPLLGVGAEIISVKVLVNGSEVSCRGTSFNLGDDVWDSVLVKTGTVCGPGKICINQRCQEAAALKVQPCQCGGHGVCNSNGNCHCDPGWAPPHCGSSGHGGSLDSGPLSRGHGSSSVAGTVVLVLLVLILIVLLVSCYLKRVSLQRKLNSVFTKSSKCQYRVTQSGSRPQRPPPPHRAQSTELQVMSPSNQVPPPPKKPLPLSPVQQCQDPLLGVPVYPQHITAVPARSAPLPPYTRRNPKV
ncbi:disintegrin and metalloproteinase domain-containing protein 15-like isoform X3 [Engystomops pustulosus]